MVAKKEPEIKYDFWIDDLIVAPAYGLIEHPFTGNVKKMYEQSLLVEITDYDKEDEITITEMNHRAIVAMSQAEIIKKGPKAPEIEEVVDKRTPAAKVKTTTKAKKTKKDAE